MRNRKIASLLLGAALMNLAGCGGSSSSDETPLGGIEGTGFAMGTISGFGSIIVNGIEFSTSTAMFTIDGRSGTQDDLRVGDVVSVVGPINTANATGTATSVTFDDNVEGPVESVDIPGSSLVVMGQTVRVDGATTFDDSVANCVFDPNLVGQVVEVSGFRDTTGLVRATRIECKAAGGELEVTGIVAALDTNQRRFQISALIVDYSQAQLQDFPSGQPANGQTVEVKGTTVNAGVLVATRVEFKGQGIPVGNGDRVEIEGLVTRFASASDFDVAGQPITTAAGTVFEDCASPFNPPLNSKVEVEGTLSSGVVSAQKVECRAGTELRVTATVDVVNAATNSLTVLGITVTVNAETRLEDKSSADVSPFRLSDLRVGDFVEVRGGPGTSGNSIAAVLLEREDPENGVELRGIAENVVAPDFRILGVDVRTGGGTSFRDEADNTISAATFFAQAPNRLVSVQGTESNDDIDASEAELEN